METNKSVEVIEAMLKETKKSLHKNAFYFIAWGIVLSIAGFVEYFFRSIPNISIVWGVAGILGGIASAVHSIVDSKRSRVTTNTDRITLFTWGAFGFTLFFSILYSVSLGKPPHTLTLMLAGSATFISGGISRFRPFIFGAIALEIGAILCGFFISPETHGLVFAISIIIGYIVPGMLLLKKEND